MFGEVLREVVLGRGLIDETGARHRRALVRPLTGWQEASLGAAGGVLDAGGVSELLASCLHSLGAYTEVTTAHASALSRCDRDLLALSLRSMMFGDRLFLTVKCPNPVCGEPADIAVSIQDLLPDVSEATPELIEVETAVGAATLREPTGADDIATARHEGGHRERSAFLWTQLLVRLGDKVSWTTTEWDALPAEVRHGLGLALAEHLKGPDLSFLSRCPSCAAWLELELDPFELLGRELHLGVERLVVELHCLAYHYSWTEAQCLALPRPRRWRYLELLKRQLEGRPLQDVWS